MSDWSRELSFSANDNVINESKPNITNGKIFLHCFGKIFLSSKEKFNIFHHLF